MAFFAQNFVSIFKALATIGPLAHGRIDSLCIAVRMLCRTAKIRFPDCIANAHVHLAYKLLRLIRNSQVMRIILNSKGFLLF